MATSPIKVPPQISPTKALQDLTSIDANSYSLEVPHALSYGNIAYGGFLMTSLHVAAVDFVAKQSSNLKHPHVRHISVSFFRPFFTGRRKGKISFRVASENRAWTILHVDVNQQDDLCLSGYLTLTNMRLPGQMTMKSGWTLSPPLVNEIQSMTELGSDSTPNWISYKTPFDGRSFRLAEGYFQYFVPINRSSSNITDQWVTPAWKDDAEEPKWTNELVHMLLDNGIPSGLDVISHKMNARYKWYDSVIQAGLEQREARYQDKDDKLWGKGMKDSSVNPFFMSTTAATTNVKKLLPAEGVKWLFLRVICRAIQNGQLDHDVLLMDETGEIVATTSLAYQVIPLGKKQADVKASL